MNDAEHARIHDTLDAAEAMDGYRAGFDGWPPNQGASWSWLHGWRNGRVDGGHDERSQFQIDHVRWYLRNRAS